MRRRFEQGDPYFGALSKKWSEGVRAAFKELPDPQWGSGGGSADPGALPP